MAFRIQSGFGAGELDPALQERTTLEKYRTGLATARNVMVGKTGRLISKNGTALYKRPKYDNKKSVLFAPSYSPYLIEWGDLYARIHNVAAGTYVEVVHTWLEADLPNIHFAAQGNELRVLCLGKSSYFVDMAGGLILPSSRYIRFPPSLPIQSVGSHTWGSSGTGFQVDYAFTIVNDGLESQYMTIKDTVLKLPILSGEHSDFHIVLDAASYSDVLKSTEMRVYRRPAGGGAYGFIGATQDFQLTPGSFPAPPGAPYYFNFVDYGQESDFSHIPPYYGYAFQTDIGGVIPRGGTPVIKPRTATFYQQRLVISGTTDESTVHTSRTGYNGLSFTRDFPYTAESALSLKITSEGVPKVLRFFDAGVLIAFTTVGVFSSEQGPFDVENLAMPKRGDWVIDDIVPAIAVPGGVMFVDRNTNAVIALTFSTERSTFVGEEISIFSNHLLQNKRIMSWAFVDGIIPTVQAVLSDGTLICLTYQKEQQMQAWTRLDTQGTYESVACYRDLAGASKMFYLTLRNGLRMIEYGTPRYVADLKKYVGVDSAITFNGDMTFLSLFSAAKNFADWDQELTLTSIAGGTFVNTTNNGAIGTVFRYFDEDGSSINLTVTAYLTSSAVKVLPSSLFPSAVASSFGIYKTRKVVTGLSHLEGKIVSVLLDGYVYGSPNNVNEGYPVYTVASGQITLPDFGAIITVGLPYSCDIETLDVDTVEQKPTLLESRLCGKVFIELYQSRGMFVGGDFPSDDTTTNMEDPEYRTEDPLGMILGNAAQAPYTRRVEVIPQAHWESNGRVCIRAVDPLPVEILSIIPDLDIYRKGQ